MFAKLLDPIYLLCRKFFANRCLAISRSVDGEILSELDTRRIILENRLRSASAAYSSTWQADKLEELFAVKKELQHLERLSAAAKCEEYAENIEFPVDWDTGAPLPHVMISDSTALLAFRVHVPDPQWDGTYVKVKSVGDVEAEPLALVTFSGYSSAKLGAPNDEVHAGHSLYHRGLESYKAQRVVNSHWLKELENINRVHRCYNSEWWRCKTHYIFWFHDTTFECVAESYKVEIFNIAWKEMFSLIVERMKL